MGVVSGDDATNLFRPSDSVNRAEFLKMVVSARGAAGINIVGPPSQIETFTDVDTGDWFYYYVEAAVYNGIIDNGTLFRPGDLLNRAEAVKMLTLAFGHTVSGDPFTDPFTDVARTQ